MRISEVRLAADGAEVELSAAITGLPDRAEPFRLWFRMPACFAPGAIGDPFLAAVLPIAIARGGRVEVDAPVSAQLVRNAAQMAAIWRGWEASFPGCEIRVAAYREPAPAAAGKGCFFTGGVDSFYTLRRLLEMAVPLTHLVFIRGYAEMPLDNEALYQQACAHLGAVAEELQLKLVCVSTNLREMLTYAHVEWDLYAGSMLAAVGLCLEPHVRRLYIPSGDTYATLSAWGSHPLTDPLWGTERLEFVHHGCEARRSEKVERAVAAWPLALEHLRVCGSGLGADYNCGYCEKCVRSAVALEACDALDRCATLPALDYDRVRGLDSTNRVVRFYLKDNLDLVRRRGGHEALREAIEEAMHPSALRAVGMRAVAAFRKMDQKWMGGAVRRMALGAAGTAESQAALKTDPGRWLLRRLKGS